jgi:dynein heavy chain
MMGAGTDPLKKDQNFSRLTTDLKSLMETKFSYPKVEENRHIPIIDSFSRTLACPIAAQRQNPLVAARIGCHLSLKSQALNLLASGIVFFKQN